MFDSTSLSVYALPVALFGENLKRLRELKGLTQETVAERMGLKKPTPISLMETTRKRAVPKPATIRRLATAVECEPWQLLVEVETPYDALRVGVDLPRHKDRGSSSARRSQAERGGIGNGSADGGGGGTTQARIQQLEKRIAAYETLIGEMQGVARRLFALASAKERGAAGTGKAGSRKVDRAAGE